MLYTATADNVNLPRISGRNIAHSKRSAVERAFVAADLHLGRYVLIKPTLAQAAKLLRVNAAYVAAAKAIAHDQAARNAVISGRVPLVVASWSETLADRYMRASPAERVALRKAAGVDQFWDELIAPAL
jgi:SpoU rRNA methylase family enzyme